MLNTGFQKGDRPKLNLSIPLIFCVTRIIFEDEKDIRQELLDTHYSISKK